MRERNRYDLSHRAGYRGLVVRSIVVLLLVGSAGCVENATEPPSPPTLEITIRFTEEQPMKRMEVQSGTRKGSLIDSMRIMRVRILVRSGLLIGAGDTVLYAREPSVVDLTPGDTSVSLAVMQVSAIRYYYLDVRFHKPEPNADLLPEYRDPRFAEFLEGVHYSLIVDGRIYDVAGNSNFTYKSRATLISRLAFSPYLYVAPGSTTRVALTANALSWFYDSTSGSYLNPIDPQNESVINTAVVNSIRAK